MLHEALSFVAEAPLASPLWRADRDYRRRRMRRFPYMVVYRIEGGVVLVVAVAHERRTPGYWTER